MQIDAMTHASRFWSVVFATGALISTDVRCEDEDALALQAAPSSESGKESPFRLAFEASVGRIERTQGLAAQDGRRVALDLRYSSTLSPAWRFSFSDRLDDIHPMPDGQRPTRNSLRELYAAWQEQGSETSIEVGRINLRNGPAMGCNPTDYFRAGALRTITTADPIALRENRLGTGMLRVSRLGADAGYSIAIAPKLDSPDDKDNAFSPAFGATNSNHRILLTGNARLSERINFQGLALAERGRSPAVGASTTALLSDAVVAYGEWSYEKSHSLRDDILNLPASPKRYHKAAIGMTYTLPTGLAVTAEAEYNGAGLDREAWLQVLSRGPAAYERFVALTQPSQELGSVRAWLIYATQKGVGLKQLDLTGFMRQNAHDHSRLVWAELRYHWDRFDAALQWQRSSGTDRSEFGVIPYRQIVLLQGTWYF